MYLDDFKDKRLDYMDRFYISCMDRPEQCSSFTTPNKDLKFIYFRLLINKPLHAIEIN